MLHNTAAATYSYFYPIGNTPPVCLTRFLPPEQDADILLLGCGDARNILFTLSQQQIPRQMDVTCCDLEPAILARNILLFSLLSDNGYATNMERIWNIYYHWKLDKASDALLKSKTLGLTKASESMEKWQASKLGKHLRFCNTSTLRDVRQVWLHWLGSPDSGVDEDVANFHVEQYKELKKHYRAKNGAGITLGTLRSASPVIAHALLTFGNMGDDYFEDGGLFKDAKEKAKAKIVNRTFFATGKRRSILHYSTQPFVGFHLAEVFAHRIHLAKKTVFERCLEVTKAQFKTWADAFRGAIDHGLTIRFFAGDALAFAHTLQFIAQAPGHITANIKSHPWTFETLTLDSSDYQPEKGGAPTMYDVIDTSNLFDHVGALNVLVSASPLLKPNIQSSLFTETIVQHYKDVKARDEANLGGSIHNVSLLLGLTVFETWTSLTVTPETDEGIYMTILKDIGQSKGPPPQQTTRQCWKHLSSFGIPKLATNTQGMVSIVSNMFKEIFRHEDFLREIAEGRIVLPTGKHYTRFAFAALITLVEKTIDSNTWIDVLGGLLDIIIPKGTASVYDKYAEDLFVSFDLVGIGTMSYLSVPPEPVLSPKLVPWLQRFKPLPRLVCVSIRVPRKDLDLLFALPLRQRPNPCFCLSLEGREKSWEQYFGAVQVGYGRMVSTSDDGRCLIEEDPSGIHGTSDLILSAFIPTRALLREDGRFNVAARYQFTRLNTTTNLLAPSLTENLVIFRTHLTDTEAVRLSAAWPDATTDSSTTSDLPPPQELWPIYQSKEIPWMTSDKVPGVTFQTLVLHTSDGNFVSASYGLQAEGEHAKALACADTPVRSESVSPHEMKIIIGDLEPLKMRFPFAISVVSVDRTLKYVVVLGQPKVLNTYLNDPQLVLPMSMSDSGQVVLWTAPSITLDKQPIVRWIHRAKDKQKKLTWIETHLSTMFSDAELLVETEQPRVPGMRRDFKNHLANIFLLPTGLHPRLKHTHRHVISFIHDDETLRVEFIIVVSRIRFDLIGRSVVADAVFMPMGPDIALDPAMIELMTTMPASASKQIPVSPDHLAVWRRALPVFAERCRTWAHVPETCEYIRHGPGKMLPPDAMLGDGISPLCSCGTGKLPANYPVTGRVPLLDGVMRKFGTRLAVSPVFPVTYIEDCTGPTVLNWD
ncbi:hypothetical protein DV738_g441, partial [Chaetothyriales sp. CBS 135597]